jgi:hypothetical protein
MRRSPLWTFGLLTLLTARTAFAVMAMPTPVRPSPFSDLATTYLHYSSILTLVDAGVVNGNPDGTFRAGDPVNRAAMLKMLYRASGRKEDAKQTRCFADVKVGSWYEAIVCDAAARLFVSGYADGTFKPEQSVTNVEALKMLTLVFGFEVAAMTKSDHDVLKQIDIDHNAWYTPYIFAAYKRGVLPIPGQDSSHFYPDRVLTRGEAAAYVANAMNAKARGDVTLSNSSASTSTNASAMTNGSSTSAASSQKSEKKPDTVFGVTFPFNDARTFEATRSVTYRFSLTEKTLVDTQVSLKVGQAGLVNCQLYKIDANGFSLEYYIGLSEGTSCYLLSALTPGDYQLQVQPTSPGTSYTVKTRKGTGDGNDGFVEASPLSNGQVRTGVLSANDNEDYYTFTITKEALQTFDVTGKIPVRCLIYPMGDVDIFGFAGPECGKEYLYPTGTYYVAIGHTAPRAGKLTYTIQLH